MVQQLSPPSLEDELLYPDRDGKPLADNTTQLRLIFTIKGGLDTLFKDRDDVFIAADLLWYPVRLTSAEIKADKQPKRQAPDVMVVLGRPKGDRGSYKQWEEDNIAPQVAFEILSPGNKNKEMETKFQFYQEYGIEEYYLYNPKKNRLQGWLRKGRKLEAIAQMENWTSPLLGIRFTTNEEDLVLFHPDGERFIEFVEAIEQRDRQTQRAARQTQRAIFAENERDRERLEKELEKQRADRERLEKELEKQRADRAESELQKMRERLIQLGIDPDSLS